MNFATRIADVLLDDEFTVAGRIGTDVQIENGEPIWIWSITITQQAFSLGLLAFIEFRTGDSSEVYWKQHLQTDQVSQLVPIKWKADKGLAIRINRGSVAGPDRPLLRQSRVLVTYQAPGM